MILIWLTFASLLEAGGDALVRAGIRSAAGARILLWIAGGLCLFGYGYTVNTPPWNFGRLLGVYIALFFVMAQIIGWLFFHETPSRGVFIGGALIVAGGAVMTALP